MKHWRILFLVASAAVTGVMVACVGDSPGDTTPSQPDASVADVAPATETSTPPPAPDAGPVHIVSVDEGDFFGCALISDGTVWCWGDNSLGQLGISPPGQDSIPATQVPNLTGVTAIAVGGSSVCVIKGDASVWCWGESTQWQTAHDPDANADPFCGSNRCNPTPSQVTGVYALQVSVNGSNACAITTNHTVMCWGSNGSGECGLPATPDQAHALPTVIGAGSKPFNAASFVSVRLGYFAAGVCALDSTGQVWCWGKNTLGALGHDAGASGDLSYMTTGNFYNYVPSVAFTNAIDFIAGAATCAVKNDGTVWCWGSNHTNYLTLDAGDGNPHPMPVQVKTVAGATSIGIGNAACALVDGGSVYCWGAGTGGLSSGAGFDGGCTTPAGGPVFCQDPAIVPGPLLTSLDVDHQSAAGLTRDGVPVTWGLNREGRLGITPTDAGYDNGFTIPAPIVGLP